MPTSQGLRIETQEGDASLARDVRAPSGTPGTLEVETLEPLRGSLRVTLRFAPADPGSLPERLASALRALFGRDRSAAEGGSVLKLEFRPRTRAADERLLVASVGDASWRIGPIEEIRLHPSREDPELTLVAVSGFPLPEEGFHQIGDEWRHCRRGAQLATALSLRDGERIQVELGLPPGRWRGVELHADLRLPGGETLERWQHRRVAQPGWTRVVLEPSPGSAHGDLELALALRESGSGSPVTGCFPPPRVLSAAAAPPARPNVLLVSLDTLRADHLKHAPFLTRLARDGRSFARSWASSNWTLPAHVSLFTSQPTLSHETPPVWLDAPYTGARMSDDLPTLAEAFAEAGYVTAASTEGGYMRVRFGLARGFDRFAVFLPPRLGGTDPLPRHERFARNFAGEEFGRPFFLFVHTYKAHDYFTNTADYHDPDAPEADRPRWEEGSYLQAIIDRSAPAGYLKRLYAAGVRRADAFVERLVDAVLEASGGNPLLVVVTSDHGESFGEHPDIWHHGTSMFEEQLRVPLIVWGNFSDAPKGVVRVPTSAIDVAPSLLHGLGLPVPEAFAGEQDRLLPVPAAQRRHPAVAGASGHGRIDQAVIDEGWKYVRSDKLDGQTLREACFDLSTDPEEVLPRAADASASCASFPELYGALLSEFAHAAVILRSDAATRVLLEEPARDGLGAVLAAHGSARPIAELSRGSLRWTPVAEGDALALILRQSPRRLARIALDGRIAAREVPADGLGTPAQPVVLQVARPDGSLATLEIFARDLPPPVVEREENPFDPELVDELRALGYVGD